MSRFFITVPKDLDEALTQLARESFRTPQGHAAWLLAEAIRAALQEKRERTAVAHVGQD